MVIGVNHFQLKDWQEKVLGAVLQGHAARCCRAAYRKWEPSATNSHRLLLEVLPWLWLRHSPSLTTTKWNTPRTMTSIHVFNTTGSYSWFCNSGWRVQGGLRDAREVTRLFPGGWPPDPWFLSLAVKGKICLLAIDKAHCMFTWQSFR